MNKQIIFTKSPIGRQSPYEMQYKIETATEGQTEFTATFTIYRVFKNNVLVNPVGVYTGHGTTAITFIDGLSAGDQIYMSN